MCGIVGLHLRTPDLHPHLGVLLSGMLCEMQDRGADSAGVAVYGDPRLSPPGQATVSLLGPADDLEALRAHLTASVGTPVTGVQAGPTQLVSAPVAPDVLRAAVATARPDALVVGFGQDLAVMKGVGQPRLLADAFGLADASGWQGVGHTRMATESAVTPAGSHPYAVGRASAWSTTDRSPTTPRCDVT